MGHVRRFLAHQFPDLYRWRNTRLRFWPFCLAVVMLICFHALLGFGVWLAAEMPFLPALFVFCTAISGCAFAWYLLFFRGRAWIDGVSPAEATQVNPPDQDTPPLKGWHVLVLVMGCVILFGIAAFLVTLGKPRLGGLFAVWGILLAGFCYWAWRRRKIEVQFDGDSVRIRHRESKKRKQPLRSPALGWTLKLAGLLYWFVVASPLTYGLFMEMSDIPFAQRDQLKMLVWVPSVA